MDGMVACSRRSGRIPTDLNITQKARYQSGNILGQEGLIVLTLHLILVNYCLTASHSWVSADAEQKNYKTYSNGQKEQVLACNS